MFSRTENLLEKKTVWSKPFNPICSFDDPPWDFKSQVATAVHIAGLIQFFHALLGKEVW